MIQFSFFKIPAFSIGSIGVFIAYLLFMVPSLVMPLFTHHVLNMPVAHMGLLMTSQAFAMFLFSPFSGWLADRLGPLIPTLAGMALISISLFRMAFLSHEVSDLAIVLSLSLFGVGFGLFFVYQ